LVNKLSNIEIKRDYINFVSSISFAVISYIILAKLISLFYKPDISIILKESGNFIISGFMYTCKPEPLEKTLFISGIFLIPLLIFAYYSIFKKLFQNKEDKIINNIWIFICLFTITAIPLFIYKVMKAPSLYVQPYSHFQLYILNSILDKDISLLIFVPFIIILYVFLRINYSSDNGSSKFTNIILNIFCLFLIAYIAAINVFPIYTNDIHFDAVFYSIVQLFKGVPLAVDGFTNTYGLYPYFLNVIFKIIGLSVFKCSIVFCILIALSYLLIILFLKKTVNNKLLVFLGFTSVVFLPILSKQLFNLKLYGQTIPYYAYLPIRYLFPCLLFFLSALYIKNKNKYLYILSSIICSLALLWNFETGAVTTLSWMLLNFYSEFEQKKASVFFKNILRHIIKIYSVMIITVLFFYLCVFIFYGRILNLTALLNALNIFSKYYFGMLPMPLIHPWNILVLAYIIGIGISVMAIIEKNITPWTKNIFLVTIMGTGMLLYYQGRSHDYSLFGPSFYFFILLTLFLDKILSFLKNNKNLLLTFLSIIIASILSLSVILMSININDEFLLLKTVITNVQAPSRMKNIIQMDCNFIRRHAGPSEKIIIYSRNSGTYFSKIPNISAFNPGFADLYLKSDYVRLEKFIAESDVKIFIAENSPESVNTMIGLFKDLKIIDSNGHIFLLGKKRLSESESGKVQKSTKNNSVRKYQ
jgi:hypothetical protein